MKKEKRVCRECMQKIEGEFVEIEGEYVCQNCFDEKYFYCDDCGKIELRDNGIWIEDSEMLVCEDCAENNYYRCEDCGNYYSSTTYITNYGEVCEHCFDWENYGYCESCENYYHTDDLHWSDRHDCYYCDDCYEEDDEELYGYHEFRDWQLFNGKNEINAPYYIGKEIELEPKNNYCLHEVLEIMNRYINGVGMHDGSLNDGGVEVVTHPESWQYLLENKENYKNFFDEMERLHYGDAGNTGLHFHVSRPNDNVIARIIVILESFKDEIKKLSRRNGNFSWSKFLTDYERDSLEKVKYQSMKYLKEDYLTKCHDRYLALNLNNSKTIEFRFFNGANNFEEFWGALQFIHNIMEVALDETRELNTITWNELIVGDELIEQAKKQEVYNIDKVARDTTDITEKLEKIKLETKEEIRKTLKNFIRYITREMESKKLEILDKNDINGIELTSHNYINELSNDLRFLEVITSAYRNLDNASLNSTKERIKNIKECDTKYYNKENKYNNYFKQIEKTFNKLESEVNG